MSLSSCSSSITLPDNKRKYKNKKATMNLCAENEYQNINLKIKTSNNKSVRYIDATNSLNNANHHKSKFSFITRFTRRSKSVNSDKRRTSRIDSITTNTNGAENTRIASFNCISSEDGTCVSIDHDLNINSPIDNHSNSSSTTRSLNMSMKAMKTLLILLMGFYLCWLPLIIYFLTFASQKYNNMTIYILMFVACCNAVIDPLVYAFRNREFCKALLLNFSRNK